MKSLNDITNDAVLECARKQLDVDVYKAGEEYKFTLTINRKSKKFERRLSYEHGNIIVRDNKDKVVLKVNTVEKKEPAKKEPQDTKNI